jgi:ribosomal protein S18 acetylase RimI-like enzyme
MSRALVIRRATIRDAAAVARLTRELGYPAPTKVMRARLRAIFASANDLLVVAAKQSGAAVGWLQAHAACIVESGFRVEITGLVVSPAARRKGVGRALVAEAERWAKSLSAEAIVVRSNAKRVASHSFYPALGYLSTKTQVVYRKALPASDAE